METRASTVAESDLIKKMKARARIHAEIMEARARIHAEIEEMRAEGKALTLSDEEIRMLESFRRFKLRMRKDAEVFTWQTVRAPNEAPNVTLPASESGR